jgi:hypothetical protein
LIPCTDVPDQKHDAKLLTNWCTHHQKENAIMDGTRARWSNHFYTYCY